MTETALVTGAPGGIGEDLARLIAAGGRDVVLNNVGVQALRLVPRRLAVKMVKALHAEH